MLCKSGMCAARSFQVDLWSRFRGVEVRVMLQLGPSRRSGLEGACLACSAGITILQPRPEATLELYTSSVVYLGRKA